MGVKRHRNRAEKLKTQGSIAFILTMVISGYLASFFIIEKKDREMRDDLLSQTRMVALSINIKSVRVLTGTLADLDSLRYQRLKNALEEIHSINPEYRFIYLIGQKAVGTAFFYMDSEP